MKESNIKIDQWGRTEFHCTKDTPWDKSMKGKYDRVIHGDSELLNERYDWYDGDGDEYHKCIHCGKEFTVYIGR